jgi:hypothetical protein
MKIPLKKFLVLRNMIFFLFVLKLDLYDPGAVGVCYGSISIVNDSLRNDVF